MRLIILDDDEAVSEWAAKYVAKRINEFKPNKDKVRTDTNKTSPFSAPLCS